MTIRLPRPFVDAAVIGSSGDARIVRCFDGASHYWAKTKPGEIALAGLRRVENFANPGYLSDPSTYPVYGGGTNSPFVGIVAGVGPNGEDAMRFVLDIAKSGDGVKHGIYDRFYYGGAFALNWVNSVYIKTFDGSTKTVAIIAPTNWTYKVVIDGSWKRFAVSTKGTIENTVYWGACVHPDVGTDLYADVLVCSPQIEQRSIPCSEYVDPRHNHGFGAPGVAYFSYANPFVTDANGVVTDTGVRTPISRGGLVVAGAANNVVSPAHTTSIEGWSLNTSATWVGVGNPLPGLPAPEGFRGDGVNTFVSAKSVNALMVTADEKFYLHVIAEVVGGADGEDSECSARGGSPTWVFPQIVLRKGFGIISDLAPLLYSHYDAGAGPNGGDLYEFIVEATEPDASNNRSFWCYSDHGVASQKIIYIHHAYLGKERPTPFLLLHSSSGTTVASRVADLMPLRWRPGLGWSPGRRLLCRVDLDTRDLLGEGTLLGGVDAGGATSASLVRVENVSGEYRVSVGDGTAAVMVPLALPAGQPAVTVQVDAGPAGLRLAVDGTEYADPTRFDFSWVAETHIGQRPDGSDACPMPINVRPESWT